MSTPINWPRQPPPLCASATELSELLDRAEKRIAARADLLMHPIVEGTLAVTMARVKDEWRICVARTQRREIPAWPGDWRPVADASVAEKIEAANLVPKMVDAMATAYRERCAAIEDALAVLTNWTNTDTPPPNP